MSIDIAKAQSLVVTVTTALSITRERELKKHPPLDTTISKAAIKMLADAADIKPRGHAVIGSYTQEMLTSTAGHVMPSLRIAYITPQAVDAAGVMLHEFAHLACIGDTDDLAVLLAPERHTLQDFRVLHSGWRRVTSAPVEYDNQRWWWSDPLIQKGHFFEEAMAQLVELLFHTYREATNDPVVFQGQDITFELPPGYSHCAAGWSVLMLEKACPGVVETLIAGARGVHDYKRLKSTIEVVFPGLFEALYDIAKGVNLVRGAELILQRI